MFKIRHLIALLLCSILLSPAYAQKRIAVLSSDVADIVVALGMANAVVGKSAVDQNPALKDVPVIGLHRSITAESVVSVKPDLVLGSWMVQPQTIFEQLQRLGVNAINVAADDSFDAYAQSIREIGKQLQKETLANTLAQKWLDQMQAFKPTQKRYLLSYDGTLAGGRNTVPDKLIQLAGGINAADFDGLKPLSREGWLLAAPDVIIIADHHAPIIGGIEKFSAREEIAGSAAARNHHIELWPANSYFRYSLDTPEVVRKLNQLAQ